MSKKMISIDLMLLQTWRAFFGHREDGIFRCEDCCFVSGSWKGGKCSQSTQL